MENKECNKYEWYFTTKSEEEFQEHLSKCPVCRAIHEKMLKAGQCVREVSEVYFARQKKHMAAVARKYISLHAIISILPPGITPSFISTNKVSEAKPEAGALNNT